MLNLAILVSGEGTTMERILKECSTGGPLEGLIRPATVIASRNRIGAIRRAIDGNLAHDRLHVCGRHQFLDDNEFGAALLELFDKHEVDMVFQCGWLCKTPHSVIKRFQNRIVNAHNGALDPGHPDFGGRGMYGRRVPAASLYFSHKSQAKRDMFTEATVHLVTNRIDGGPVIGRKVVEIEKKDEVEHLRLRVLKEEHDLQVQTLAKIGMIGLNRMASLIVERDERLILPDQKDLLATAKSVAEAMYPKG
jgi:phosphoribosylglycinamide formyltransferase-1